MGFDPIEETIERAAVLIARARAIDVTAGAGMGVDSGLPVFRGPTGLWSAQTLSPEQLSSAEIFDTDPHTAWRFYAQRAAQFRNTTPHAGFDILRRWSTERSMTVFTSNIDGHFHKAGISCMIYEVHGSIHHLQCATPCTDTLWTADEDDLRVAFDETAPLPRCPSCGGIARPNILLFGDTRFVTARRDEQASRYAEAISTRTPMPSVLLEIGAGRALPTVRHHGMRLRNSTNAHFIRIDPDPSGPPVDTLRIALSAREALEQIDARIGAIRSHTS